VLLAALAILLPARTANVAADPRFTGCRVGGGLGLAANTGQTANVAQRRNELSFFMDPRFMAPLPVTPAVWLVGAGTPALIGVIRAISSFAPTATNSTIA
jgi:hypothetical protein